MMPSIECRAGGAEAADWMAPPDYVIRAALDGVDRTAAEMERKWGVGRLRLLVSDLLRAKFDAQKDRLDAAIETDREPYVRAQAEGMRRRRSRPRSGNASCRRPAR
jgi:hypothetical protein